MKKIIFAVSLILIAILSGCTGGNGAGTKAFLGGTSGLDLSFGDSQPPDKVADNNQESFEIAIVAKNKGEAAVSSGKAIATLSGIEASAFGFSSLNTANAQEISKREKQGSSDVLEGGTEIISFGNGNYKYKLMGDFQTTIKADVCYNYETNAVFSMCLKKNTIQKKSADDACDIEATKSVENSGAPVQISDVKESPNGNNAAKITFTINKVGSGTLFKEDTFSVASGCVENDEQKDKVDVLIEPQSGVSISCSRLNGANQGTIKLYDSKATLVCDVSTANSQDTAFETPVKLKVRYMYKDSLKKNLVITRT